MWFPKGPDDPDLVLLSVEPEIAEFWDVGGIKGLRYLFDAAKPTSPATAWRSKTRATCTRGCASDAGGAS